RPSHSPSGADVSDGRTNANPERPASGMISAAQASCGGPWSWNPLHETRAARAARLFPSRCSNGTIAPAAQKLHNENHPSEQGTGNVGLQARLYETERPRNQECSLPETRPFKQVAVQSRGKQNAPDRRSHRRPENGRPVADHQQSRLVNEHERHDEAGGANLHGGYSAGPKL